MPASLKGKPLIARLRELRKSHGLTQEKFSERSGVAYKYYQLIETGLRMDLRLSTLEKIANVYGIGVHELLSPDFPKVPALETPARKSKVKAAKASSRAVDAV